MVRNMEQARVVTRVPVELGKIGVRASLWSGKLAAQTALYTLGIVRGLSVGNEHIAERLAATLPLNEAKMGAADVARGLRAGDTELTGIGEREVARAVVLADRSSKVSDEVTSAVVGIARRLPVDPLAASLVRPELADEARDVMERFGHVSPRAGDGSRAE